jgi:putative phage-type endonuclease
MKISSAPTTEDGGSLQRTEAWLRDRSGRVTASPILKVYKRLKNGGYSKERETYKLQLIAERLVGTTIEGRKSAAMQRGVEKEAEARDRYARTTNLPVTEAPFVPHPTIGDAGASPDGFVGEEGLVEIKAPTSQTAVEILLTEEVPEEYYAQCQWQMAVTGRKWVDFVVFDDRLPSSMQLFVKRIDRDELLIRGVEKEVREFIAEISADIERLWNKYPI